jgi:hypothetical protein
MYRGGGVMRQEIDLEQHILYIAFRNKFIEPSSPVTTQELAARLMVEYPQTFPNSIKIMYTIAAMKMEGLIDEQQQFDKIAFEKCLEEMKQQHPKMKESNVRKECYKKIGVRGVILPTEAGVIEFCSRVKPHLTGRSTRTNSRILDVCETYRVEGERH